MIEYNCIRKCFYKNRVFEKGERYAAPPSEQVPKHFVKASEHKAPVVKEEKEPSTMHEINVQNQELQKRPDFKKK